MRRTIAALWTRQRRSALRPWMIGSSGPVDDRTVRPFDQQTIELRIVQLDQRTALPDQCLHSAEAVVRPPKGGRQSLTHGGLATTIDIWLDRPLRIPGVELRQQYCRILILWGGHA